MSPGWAGPTWGEPSSAHQVPVPLRASAWAGDAAYRADGGIADDFVVLAASVAGVSHRLAGRRGEDSFGWAQPGPGRLAIVVADGVSTAGRGGEGADLAVRAACRHLEGSPGRWGEMECLAALTVASQEIAATAGDDAAELSTTLVVALLASAADGGPCRASVARAGDSTAFTLSPVGAWRELFPAPGAPPAGPGGQDDGHEMKAPVVAVLPFLTPGSDRGVEHTALELPPSTALVLLTDGVADPLRDGPNTVAPALAGSLLAAGRGELSPLALAHLADFSRRGAHDDRTLILACAPPAR